MRSFLFILVFIFCTVAQGVSAQAQSIISEVLEGVFANGEEEEIPAPEFGRTLNDMGIAVLRSINKTSARTVTFEIPVDKAVRFGASLYIKVRACRKAPPIEQPESAAFLQIWEKDIKTQESKWVFSGWMFASSPAVSAMEHPVYDVWVLDCKESPEHAAPEELTSEETPDGMPAQEGAAP